MTRVFATETRPWLQGARLTVWELQQDGIAATLIADTAAAHLMKTGAVQWVIVGADRIAPMVIPPTRSAPTNWRSWPATTV